MKSGLVMHDVLSRGVRIRCAETGSGTPIIFLHGFLASRRSFDDVIDAFASRHRLLLPDLPGFGESEKPSDGIYNYDSFRDASLDVAAAMQATRFSIVGHDLGASIALAVAARYPELVESLVLIAPRVYDRQTTIARLLGVPVLGPILFKQTIGQRMFERILQTPNRPSTDSRRARTREWFDTFNAPEAREAAFATLRGTQDARSIHAALPMVRARALVVWGNHDRITPVEHGRRLVHELPGSRFEVLDGGHSPHEEHPEAFADAAMRFLLPPESAKRRSR